RGRSRACAWPYVIAPCYHLLLSAGTHFERRRPPLVEDRRTGASSAADRGLLLEARVEPPVHLVRSPRHVLHRAAAPPIPGERDTQTALPAVGPEHLVGPAPARADPTWTGLPAESSLLSSAAPGRLP